MARKQSANGRTFVSGVVILTVSGLLVKTAGLLFKIPMNRIVGDTGMGYYNSAYSVYTLFYMLSTSGLPVALSVMVSEYRAEGKIAAAKRVYRLAMLLFVIAGAAVSAVMSFGCGGLAEWIRSEHSALSIAVIAPTMLFICVSSAVRGYFQGCGNMVPTAVSQLIEAFGKLLIGIAAASFAIRRGMGVHRVSAYAVSGLTVGSLAGMLYLLAVRFLRGDRDLLLPEPKINGELPKRREILRRFGKIALPVTVSASVMSLTNAIDTAMIQRILQHSGMTEEAAATLYGNYTSLAVPMFNLPPVLVYPIAYALVPTVAAAFASGKKAEAAERIGAAMRYAVIIGLPCALGLTVLADPILCLLYTESSAHLASPLLILLAPSSFFVCVLAVTNSVLQACGQERRPVISMLCGAVVKCASSVILLEKFGMAGAPLSTFLCYLTVTVINLAFVMSSTGMKLSPGPTLLKPLIAGLACALTAHLTNGALCRVTDPRAACLLAILTAVLVYAAVLLFTGAVTPEELRMLCGKFTRRTGKGIKNEHNGPQTEAENREKARLRVPVPAGGGSPQRGRLPMGQRTDPSLHPHRPDRGDL